MSAGRLQAERAAAAGKRSSFGALRAIGINDNPPACPYPGHRETDWTRADGTGATRNGRPIGQCGICHPPAAGLDVVRVGS